MADAVNAVTLGFKPRTVPTEYFYFLHISSYSEVSNTDTIFINDSTLSISVTAAQTTTSEISGSGTVGGREFWEQCLIAVVLSSIALAAMIGNVLIIAAVWRYRRLRSVTNCFVVSLALADLLVSILVLPLNIVVEVTGQWLFGSIVCDLWVSSDVLLCTSSILNLCCISLDRYFAITRPLVYSTRRNKRLAIFMVAVAWGLAAVITCPPIFGWKEEGRDLADGCSLTRDPGYIIYSACGSFFIPLLVMLFVYARIYHVAMKREKRLRPYWRTFFDGHQRQQTTSGEGAACKRQFIASSSVDTNNAHGPTPTSACSVTGLSRSTSSAVTGARPAPLIRDTTAPTENDDFGCRVIPQTEYRIEKGFLRRFKSSFGRCSKTQSRRFRNTTGGTNVPEKRTPTPARSEAKLTNPGEQGDDRSSNNRRSSNSSSSCSNNTNTNDRLKPIKNKVGFFSSCYSHQQQQQLHHQHQLCRNNDNHDTDNVAGRGVALTPSMTQASIPLLAPMASFSDDFNSGDDDEPAITLVNITTNRDDEKDSTKLPSPHNDVSNCNSPRKNRTLKTTTNRRSDNISGEYPRRLLHSSTRNQRSSYDRSSHSTGSYTDRVQLKKRLGLDRRRVIPRRYITCLSSRTSRLPQRSCRPTLEITPPSPSPGSDRSISTSVTTSITGAATTTNSAAIVTSTVRRTDGESASSRHLNRLPAGSEETSAAENRRRNRVVERSLYMKERKTAKTLAIVVGCFVVCWLPFFLVYVIDVFCTQCHVTPTLFSALTWLGYFNSALNPLIYALYNTGFRHAFWNLTFGLCFAGDRRPAHLLPGVTSYGGRAVTGVNLRSTFSTVTDMK